MSLTCAEKSGDKTHRSSARRIRATEPTSFVRAREVLKLSQAPPGLHRCDPFFRECWRAKYIGSVHLAGDKLPVAEFGMLARDRFGAIESLPANAAPRHRAHRAGSHDSRQ